MGIKRKRRLVALKMKRILSLFVILSALLSCCACSPSQITETSGKGRYMEAKVQLPLPDGASTQQAIGMCATAGKMEYFTLTSNGDEDNYIVTYYRHTLSDDDSVSTQSEQWLNDHVPRGGNMIMVVKAMDGTLYASYGDYDESGNATNHILVSKDDGKTAMALTGNGPAACDMISGLVPLADGRIILEDVDGSLFVLDTEGNIEKELEGGASYGALAVSGSRIASLAPSGKAIRVYDLASAKSVDWEIEAGLESGFQLAFSQEGTLYLACPTGLYRHTSDGTLWESFVDGDVTNLGIPSYYISHLAVKGAKQDVLYVSDYNAEVYRYAYDPEAAQTASIELDIFSLEANDVVRQAVVSFSRQHSDVKVNYTVAMKLNGGGTAQDYIKALNAELLAGAGPDIILLDGLPVDSYIEKDVLLDIAEFVDGADPLLTNIRKAYEKDGRLYAIPLGVEIPVILSKGGMKAAFASIAALADAAEAGGDKPLLSPIAYSYETLGTMLLRYYGDALYAGDANAAQEFLTQAKRISNAIGATDTLGDGMEITGMSQREVADMIRKNNFAAQLYAYVFNKTPNVVFETHALDDPGCMLGTSTAEQYGGSLISLGDRFSAVGLAGINKASKHQETAAQFLQLMLSADVQKACAFSQGYPVNTAALDAGFAKESSNTSVGMWLDETTSVMGAWPSAAMRSRLRGILNQLSVPLNDHSELDNMLLPEIIAYLDGSATLESASEKLASALSTYLSE